MRDAGFEAFIRGEYRRVVRTAYWMTGDQQDAADLAQEAFTRAYERWRTVSRMDRPDAWVQRVVVNLALSERRRRRIMKMVRSREQIGVVPEIQVPDPALRDALLALTPAQRSVIVLRYYVDRSIDDVASDLGKRPGTVRALTAQGLARLREQMRTEGDRHDARR
jgi:RNA polymerase sigma-70 factor (sigma-E family)